LREKQDYETSGFSSFETRIQRAPQFYQQNTSTSGFIAGFGLLRRMLAASSPPLTLVHRITTLFSRELAIKGVAAFAPGVL
jgi:hypothetical protein